MRAITLTQPWASLVAIGAKAIETRSRNIVGSHRDRIAIHAGKGLDLVGGRAGLLAMVKHDTPFAFALVGAGFQTPEAATDALLARCGHIVATARVDSVVSTAEAIANGIVQIDSAEHAFGDYGPGRVAIVFAGIDMVDPPVRVKGSLGLWRVPADVADLVDQRRHSRDPVRL